MVARARSVDSGITRERKLNVAKLLVHYYQTKEDKLHQRVRNHSQLSRYHSFINIDDQAQARHNFHLKNLRRSLKNRVKKRKDKIILFPGKKPNIILFPPRPRSKRSSLSPELSFIYNSENDDLKFIPSSSFSSSFFLYRF